MFASVFNVIKFLGYDCKITNDLDYIQNSSHIILPGVGSYSAAMKKMKKKVSIIDLEHEVLKKKKTISRYLCRDANLIILWT